MESSENLFGRADRTLYVAKKHGRDRTVATVAGAHVPSRELLPVTDV